MAHVGLDRSNVERDIVGPATAVLRGEHACDRFHLCLITCLGSCAVHLDIANRQWVDSGPSDYLRVKMGLRLVVGMCDGHGFRRMISGCGQHNSKNVVVVSLSVFESFQYDAANA